MYKKSARYLTNQFVKHGSISQEKVNVYAYGFEILISTIIYTIIFLITAAITDTILESLLFWFGFFIVRTIAGGYHAKTYIFCHILFLLNHIAFIVILKSIPSDAIIFLNSCSMLTSAICLFKFAPVDHPNKRFTKNEKNKFRAGSVAYAFLILAITSLAFAFHFLNNALYLSYSIGTFSASTSVVIAKIIKQ